MGEREKGRSDHHSWSLTFQWDANHESRKLRSEQGERLCRGKRQDKRPNILSIHFRYHFGGLTATYFPFAELFIFMLQHERKLGRVNNSKSMQFGTRTDH